MSKLKKCVAVFCLFCVLVYSMSAPARAIAGVDDLIITGGTVMTMALLGSLGIMALSAAGVGDALVNAAQQAGQSAKEFGQNLFASYARSQNITAGQSVQLAAQGISYLEDGTIVFNRAVSNMMDSFVNWAWDVNGGNLISSDTPLPTEGVVDTSSIDKSNLIYESYTYNIATVLASRIELEYGYYVILSAPCYVYSIGSNNTACVSDTQVERSLYSPNGTLVNTKSLVQVSHNGINYYYDTWNFNSVSPTVGKTVVLNGSGSSATVNANVRWDIGYQIYNGVIVSDPVYDTNLDVFDGVNDSPDTNVGAYLDTGQLLQDLDAGTAAELANGGTIDIQDWIDCIIDLIAEGEAVVPVDVVGGDVLDVPLEHVGEMDIPVEIDTPTEGADEKDVATSTSVDGLDDYTLDLVDFFPFCIPFDIYDMLSMFSAQREAPVVNWRFYVPGICDETIELDFSIFNSAAQVLRSVELVAAAIGLAFVTKKLIQGGD